MGFIYVRTHYSYADYSVCKLGKTQDLLSRSYTYSTGEYIKGKYILIIKIITPYDHHQSELLLQQHFHRWHKRDTGGCEFYDVAIIPMITDVLNICNIPYHKYDDTELMTLAREEKEYIFNKSLQHDLLINKYDIEYKKYKNIMKKVLQELHTYHEYRNKLQRAYRNDIIKELRLNNKAFLKAPTGFGKTRIIYDIILKLRCPRILIFTPRKLLNEQCTSNKYNKLHSHKVIHFSDDAIDKEKIIKHATSINKLIMTSCYQSMHKLCRYTIKYGLHFDLIVYDEAHYLNEECRHEFGEYELFASATPHKYIIDNPKIFGKIIEKIYIYDLINKQVLCNIVTLIKKIDTIRSVHTSLCLLITDAMAKFNKRKGIIYMNSINNATALYHLISTSISTYIYVSKIIPDITPDRCNITLFEEECQPAIIICVGKISYGYDNENIDFICLGDPRHSDIDIRQIIGRGLRWYHTTYPDKLLHMMIPIYEDELTRNCDRLTKYLDYIISECGQDIIIKGDKFDIINKSDIKVSSIKNYDGNIDDILTLKQYSTNYYSMYTNFMKFLQYHKIYDTYGYN